MCRLLGVVSREPISLDQAVAEEIEPFTAQSEVHGDGWGVAWFQADDGERPRPGAIGGATGGLGNPRTPQIRRRLDVARESTAYRAAVHTATGPLMLIHLRKASPGSPLQIANTHPFREGETVFAHNGQFDLPPGLREAVLARGGRTPEGTTDSELFFSLIELHARDAEPATAVQRAAAELTALGLEYGTRVPEALNCLYMTPDLLVAYQQSDPAQARPHHTADNYSLRYRIDADRVIVASTGIPQAVYLEVGEGQALVVDRSDLGVSLRPRLAELTA
ncbi:class II glutamine amidotransferase [Brachybacterium vulturis]|uniref:Class II glutamine amidotransferase n=1 Tax=Brachybacterium vulturis TaxID=2017484 RepID=A0A291GKZ7_9MICO|nr:class II glutamine amidotransferase [Brachybacterium vulturis]ATG50740.1 class II glutamine amidotransferase [Brachybacterium vulturis]